MVNIFLVRGSLLTFRLTLEILSYHILARLEQHRYEYSQSLQVQVHGKAFLPTFLGTRVKKIPMLPDFLHVRSLQIARSISRKRCLDSILGYTTCQKGIHFILFSHDVCREITKLIPWKKSLDSISFGVHYVRE